MEGRLAANVVVIEVYKSCRQDRRWTRQVLKFFFYLFADVFFLIRLME